jgi:hypothetical protein
VVHRNHRDSDIRADADRSADAHPYGRALTYIAT